MTIAALPLLTAAHVRPEGVTFTARTPQGEHAVTLPRPLYLGRAPQPDGSEALTLSAAPQAAQPLARYRVEPFTPEGQAALIALGASGPFPVPQGVSLGGYGHGSPLSEAQALSLAALGAFTSGDWALCPDQGETGRLTLLWGNSATAAQLERSSTWAALSAAGVRAQGSERGRA